VYACTPGIRHFLDYCTVFGVHSFRQVLDYHIVSGTVLFVVAMSQRFASSGTGDARPVLHITSRCCDLMPCTYPLYCTMKFLSYQCDASRISARLSDIAACDRNYLPCVPRCAASTSGEVESASHSHQLGFCSSTNTARPGVRVPDY
jgi:hypothetical protein